MGNPKKSFTLLELIIVIIIVSILATLGYVQYGKFMEKARGAEARMILGSIRKLAFAYRLEMGSTDGIQNGDVNIGPASDQIPRQYDCRSTHYFNYFVDSGYFSDPRIRVYVHRCSEGEGGKSPPLACSPACEYIWDHDLITGQTLVYWRQGPECCPDYGLQ